MSVCISLDWKISCSSKLEAKNKAMEHFLWCCSCMGLPWWLSGEESTTIQEPREMQVWSLGQEDHFGEGNGNLLQSSCLENPMDRGAWQATVQSVAKGWTCLSTWANHPIWIRVRSRTSPHSPFPNLHVGFLLVIIKRNMTEAESPVRQGLGEWRRGQ